jgi:hypothetical protein
MGKLIIDKVTGTVLNIEGCYVIDADQLDDSFTDSEIADLADRVGVKVEDPDDVSEVIWFDTLTDRQKLDTMEEHDGIELYHQMSSKFGWVGCIFTVADIRMKLAEDGLEGDELEKMVEKVQWTRWWHRTMDNAMNGAGYEILDEAIYEAKNGETE